MSNEPLPAAAYTLPAWVGEDLQILHAELLARMRRDIANMGGFLAINEMLAERVVFNYIVLKSKEVAAVGEPGGWAHERNQKEFNTFWLLTVRELNNLTTKPAHDGIRSALLEKMADAISVSLADVPPEMRNSLSESLIRAVEMVEL